MEQSKDVQKPQDHGNHDDRVQNGLDRSLHRYQVDQPEQDTDYNERYQYLKKGHFSISLALSADTRCGAGALQRISVLNREM
jgi:hypothetical protein